MLNDGGTWGWPNAGIVYVVNKKDQIANMVKGDPNCFEAYMGEVVFESIGWNVKYQGKERHADGSAWSGSVANGSAR